MAVDRRIEPEIFVEGMDVVIKLDLGKHKEMLAQSQAELVTFQQAVSHEVAKKKHYWRLIGKGQYNDDSLRQSVEDIKINIRHMSDKVKVTQEKIQHHTIIVDTLTAQLAEYNRVYATLH